MSDIGFPYDAKGRKRNPRCKYDGIVAFASRMRVSRIHAYLVLTGQRKSPRLLELWAKWQPLHLSIQEDLLRAGVIGPKREPVSEAEQIAASVARIAVVRATGRLGGGAN
jgi:hypothetical protein